jgi:hypothetical protein
MRSAGQIMRLIFAIGHSSRVAMSWVYVIEPT